MLPYIDDLVGLWLFETIALNLKQGLLIKTSCSAIVFYNKCKKMSFLSF